MKSKHLILSAVLMSVGLAGAAEMRGGGPGPASGGGVLLPPVTRPTTTPPTPVTNMPLNYSRTCSGGGTRTTAGSWNITAGTLDVTTTYAACIVSNSGEQQDGTSTARGTLALTTSSSGLNVNLTFTDNLTVRRAGATVVTYVCNRTRQGSFDQATQIFDGTTAVTNCTTTGRVHDFEGVAEQLLREYGILSGTAPTSPIPIGGPMPMGREH